MYIFYFVKEPNNKILKKCEFYIWFFEDSSFWQSSASYRIIRSRYIFSFNILKLDVINHKSLVLCVLFLPFLPLERVFSWCVFRENPVHMVYQKPILTLNHRQEVRISCQRNRENHSFHCLLSFSDIIFF